MGRRHERPGGRGDETARCTRSQAILRARWMGEAKATLHDLADEYGVSAERIRQIEANAIKKLRKLAAPEAA